MLPGLVVILGITFVSLLATLTCLIHFAQSSEGTMVYGLQQDADSKYHTLLPWATSWFFSSMWSWEA